jgi:hypothetical protein
MYLKIVEMVLIQTVRELDPSVYKMHCCTSHSYVATVYLSKNTPTKKIHEGHLMSNSS